MQNDAATMPVMTTKRKGWTVAKLRAIGRQFEAARGEEARSSVARRARVADKTLERIETGKDSGSDGVPWPPRAKSVVKVCKALGLDVAYMLEQYGLPMPPSEEFEFEGGEVTYEEIKDRWEELQQMMGEFLGSHEQ